MRDALILALDQGGHSSRAIVFNRRGEKLAAAAIAVESLSPATAWVEQCPEALLESLRNSARLALEQLPVSLRAKVSIAALVCQRSSLALWDQMTGEPLYPVISWQDRRAATELAAMALDAAEIRACTGLTPSAHYGASKIAWCLKHLPKVRQAARLKRLKCGPLASWLAIRLTGSKRAWVDPANASRTLLWNRHSGQWDANLLARFGVDRDWLPELAPTYFSFGKLSVAGALIPLHLLNGDQSAALFAAGPLEGDQLYLNVGTGAFLSLLWQSNRPVPEGLLNSLVFQGEQTLSVLEGTVNGAASALDWAQQQLGLDTLSNLPHWLQTEVNVPLFINGVSGLGSPYWAEITPEFVGDGSAPQKMVAVVESILFLVQVNLQLMQSAQPVRGVRISGGLARLDTFCQKLADLSNLSVSRAEEPEATARGAAFLVAGQPAAWNKPQHQVFLPNRVMGGRLRQRYRHWRALLEQRLKAAEV